MENASTKGSSEAQAVENKEKQKVVLGVQFFLNKLYDILSSNEYQKIICWAGDGDRFNILNPSAFQTKILPIYFKHNNIKSFVRQLNLHGFKKIRVGARITESTIDSYRHTHFRQNRPDLLSLIKRKVPKVQDFLDQYTFEQLKPVFEDPNVSEPQISSIVNQIQEAQAEQIRIEESDPFLLHFIDSCSRSKYGSLIGKAIQVYTKFKDADTMINSRIGQYVFQLTEDYISNVNKFISSVTNPQESIKEIELTKEEEMLGKRNQEIWAQELAVFKSNYKERRKDTPDYLQIKFNPLSPFARDLYL